MTVQPSKDACALNAAITRRWFTEGWITNAAMAEEIFSPKFTTNGLLAGIEGPKQTVLRRLAAFPDLSTEIEALISTGDTVVIRLLWHGTQTGPYSGIPATGKPVAVRVMSMWRFEDGKVVDNWTLQDQFGLLQQVGYLSSDLTSAQGTTAVKPDQSVSR